MTFDEIVKLFADAVKSTEIRWRDTMYCNMQYYYAEERLYLLRISNQGHYEYTFTYANDPQEAAIETQHARNRPEIETKNGWHIDRNGNRWDADKFTAEQAESNSRYMNNCGNCINCCDCQNCYNCVKCSYCRGCYSCIDCLHCTECMFCIYCSHLVRIHDKSFHWTGIPVFNYFSPCPDGFTELIAQPKKLSERFIFLSDNGKWFSHFCCTHYDTKNEAKSATVNALKKVFDVMRWKKHKNGG